MRKNWNIEPLLSETQLRERIRVELHAENEDRMATQMIRNMVRFTEGGTR
jgi:hypothetical protein